MGLWKPGSAAGHCHTSTSEQMEIMKRLCHRVPGFERSFVLLMSLAIGACAGEGTPEASRPADSPATAAQSANPQPQPGRYTLADFGSLRWLEGSWRGALPDGGYFYERYHFVDDSTIVMHGFADSTFSTPNDTSRISLRGQTVASEGSSRYVATALGSRSVSFAPTRAGANHFTWSRDSENAWTATLRSAGEPPRTTVYKLERVAP